MTVEIVNDEISTDEAQQFMDEWEAINAESTVIREEANRDTHVLHIIGNLKGVIPDIVCLLESKQHCNREIFEMSKQQLHSLRIYLDLLQRYPSFKEKEFKDSDGMFPEHQYMLKSSSSLEYPLYAEERLKEMFPNI